jgi:transposase
VGRKREVVLRLLRGESVEALARELGVEIYRLEKWKDRALSGIDTSLRERGGDPLEKEQDAARQKIGELSMEIELLRVRCRGGGPLARGRSRN